MGLFPYRKRRAGQEMSRKNEWMDCQSPLLRLRLWLRCAFPVAMNRQVARAFGRACVPLLLGGALAAPALARDALGVFNRWGAFRDAPQGRCFAIAEPTDWRDPRRRWSPFASVGYFPRQAVRGQVNLRLSREMQPGSKATLNVGGKRFTLSGGGADVWAEDRRDDAAIVAGLRAGGTMSVHGRAANGASFTDHYELRGAATAIDAAALGCARIR
jgi:hypothetical protein